MKRALNCQNSKFGFVTVFQIKLISPKKNITYNTVLVRKFVVFRSLDLQDIIDDFLVTFSQKQ